MPLPKAGQEWPPKPLAQIRAKQDEWNAWYVGDQVGLTNVYAYAAGIPGQVNRPAQFRGGVQGTLARMWWGRPVMNPNQVDDDRTHIPLAADLCQASADLLYAEPPSLVSIDPKSKTQQELDAAAKDDMLVEQLAGAAELAAALGDTYLRVTWDQSIADRSFITAVDADAAWPEFRWGRLAAVTFWWVVHREGNVWWRHVERHELDGNGHGVIFHGLYQGSIDNLGVVVPLAEHQSTAGLASVVDEQAMITTGTPGLAVVHQRNRGPQKRWRNDPAGRFLGRSDLDGVESLMDKLDMVYSSWMRDIRLAKARLIIPDFMLQSAGVGQGAFFDTDQDVYLRVNTPPRDDGASQITPQQFDIRVEQHAKSAQQLVEDILRTAGYSKQTFGEGDEVAQTATEVGSKDRRTALTRDRKIRSARPAIGALLSKKLMIDAEFFRTGVSDFNVTVKFAESAQADQLQLAQTNLALFQAQAASARTRVQMQHPDWDEKAIDAEADLIMSEFTVAVPDPTGFEPAGPGTPAPVEPEDVDES